MVTLLQYIYHKEDGISDDVTCYVAMRTPSRFITSIYHKVNIIWFHVPCHLTMMTIRVHVPLLYDNEDDIWVTCMYQMQPIRLLYYYVTRPISPQLNVAVKKEIPDNAILRNLRL